MTEPNIRNYDSVENLHIGDNYTGEESAKANPPTYAVKYVINIPKEEPKAKPRTPSASETYSPEELAEYQEYMARLRANEPKTHKAKWW